MKRSSFFILVAFWGLVLWSGCTPYYVTANFGERTARHETIAVVPFEMIYTGIIPDNLSPTELQDLEAAESQAFMISFYHEILRSTKSGKHPIRVDVQPYDRTLDLLAARDIGIQESWRMPADELARLLKVDAIVRARIEKNQLMPDLASYGIEVGVRVLQVLSDHHLWPLLPHEITKAKEIHGSYNLHDLTGETVLWSVGIKEEADWRMPANEIIDNFNRRAARKFPYREEVPMM
jgi:hypothetical protein